MLLRRASGALISVGGISLKHLAFALFFGGLASQLPAASIPINNPSFEADVLTCAPGCSTDGSITGWTGTVSAATRFGVYKPGTASYPLGVPDGVNVAYLLEDGPSVSISQTLSATVQANDTYTLDSFAGVRLDSGVFNPGLGCYGLSVSLEAGGVVLAADNNFLTSPCPKAGTFEALTLSYTSGAKPAQLGDPLQIVLTAGGSGSPFEPAEIDFDNLSLSDTLSGPVSGVPEPAVAGTTAVAFLFCGLAFRRRTRRIGNKLSE